MNGYPKQLQVPDFNKKEIKEIAVEGVNEGIASGQVNIPEGGSKLYTHALRVNYPSGPGINFISDNSTPLSMDNISLPNFYIVYNLKAATTILQQFLLSNAGYPGAKTYLDMYYFSKEDKATLTYERIEVTSLSDTITEL